MWLSENTGTETKQQNIKSATESKHPTSVLLVSRFQILFVIFFIVKYKYSSKKRKIKVVLSSKVSMYQRETYLQATVIICWYLSGFHWIKAMNLFQRAKTWSSQDAFHVQLFRFWPWQDLSKQFLLCITKLSGDKLLVSESAVFLTSMGKLTPTCNWALFIMYTSLVLKQKESLINHLASFSFSYLLLGDFKFHQFWNVTSWAIPCLSPTSFAIDDTTNMCGHGNNNCLHYFPGAWRPLWLKLVWGSC